MKQENTAESLNQIKLKWFQRQLIVWGEEYLRVFPWRQTQDAYAILIAEFLLQQTDAPRVVPIYQELLEKYPTLNALADASVTEIADILKPLGLHYRALRLSRVARAISEDPDCRGEIPQDEFKLVKLPGIGRYIARSICANAFNQPVAVLDTNVSRILQRFFGLTPRLKRARDDSFFWNTAQRVAPDTNIGLWNLTLIDFGAIICTFRNPRCLECPLLQQCNYGRMISSSQKPLAE